MGQAGAALRAAAGQNLAAIAGGHTLAEAVLLGALALLGLIGTNHACTPPVPSWRQCRPSTTAINSLRFSVSFASFGVSVIIPYFSQNCQLHFVIFLSSFVFFRRLVFFAKKFWKTQILLFNVDTEKTRKNDCLKVRKMV
jgi:hypothetical protein